MALDNGENRGAGSVLIFIPSVLLGGITFLIFGLPLVGVVGGMGLGCLLAGKKMEVETKRGTVVKTVRGRLVDKVLSTISLIASLFMFNIADQVEQFENLQWEPIAPQPEVFWSIFVWLFIFILFMTSGGYRLFKKLLSLFNKEDPRLRAFENHIFDEVGLSKEDKDTEETLYPEIEKKYIDKDQNPNILIKPLKGQTIKKYEYCLEEIASIWGVPEVTAKVIKTGGYPKILLTGLLNEITGPELKAPWKQIDTSKHILECVKNVNLGVFADPDFEEEFAQPFNTGLNARNFVIGGIPGSGKSSIINNLIANFACHPDARVLFIDLKNGVELGKWKGFVDGMSSGPGDFEKTQNVVKLLKMVQHDMGLRYKRMKKDGVTNAYAEKYLGPKEPLKIVVIDECSVLFDQGADRGKTASEAEETIKNIIQQGRAAGYILIMATQNPTSENLPMAIRNLFSNGFCYRVKTEFQASSTLGNGFANRDNANVMALKIGEMINLEEDYPTGIKVKTSYFDQNSMMDQLKPNGKRFFTNKDVCEWLDEMEAETEDSDDDINSEEDISILDMLDIKKKSKTSKEEISESSSPEKKVEKPAEQSVQKLAFFDKLSMLQNKTQNNK